MNRHFSKEDNLKKNLVNVYLFLTERERERERERDRAWVGEGKREPETQSKAGSRLWAVSTETDWGLKLMNSEIMTWAKVRCLSYWATQMPCSQRILLSKKMNIVLITYKIKLKSGTGESEGPPAITRTCSLGNLSGHEQWLSLIHPSSLHSSPDMKMLGRQNEQVVLRAKTWMKAFILVR